MFRLKKIALAIINRIIFSAVFLYSVLTAVNSAATPSTTCWTPNVMDIQSFGVLHVGVDNYFSVLKDGKDPVKSFPTDSGLAIGILPFDKIQMEVGVDAFYPQDANNAPIYFNGKIGSPEDGLFKNAPGIGAGIFNAGTKKDKTNYNIGYGYIGKSIPYIGRVTAGYYYGNDRLLVDTEGQKDNKGYMVSFDRGFFKVKDASGEYDKILFGADYAAGKNAFGGGGGSILYYFTKDVGLLIGAVRFNNKDINGKWKVTLQLDANINIFGK